MADQTLAQLIKAKYPGSYDNLDDVDLEQKILAKYPGVYDKLPRSLHTERPAPDTTENDKWNTIEGSAGEGAGYHPTGQQTAAGLLGLTGLGTAAAAPVAAAETAGLFGGSYGISKLPPWARTPAELLLVGAGIKSPHGSKLLKTVMDKTGFGKGAVAAEEMAAKPSGVTRAQQIEGFEMPATRATRPKPIIGGAEVQNARINPRTNEWVIEGHPTPKSPPDRFSMPKSETEKIFETHMGERYGEDTPLPGNGTFKEPVKAQPRPVHDSQSKSARGGKMSDTDRRIYREEIAKGATDDAAMEVVRRESKMRAPYRYMAGKASKVSKAGAK